MRANTNAKEFEASSLSKPLLWHHQFEEKNGPSKFVAVSGRGKPKAKEEFVLCATSIIYIIKLCIFIIMATKCGFSPLSSNPFIGPHRVQVFSWGAVSSELIIKENQYWRLLSSIFLSNGLVDLSLNTSLVFILGLEKKWGSATWMLVYFMAGFGGNIFTIAFSPNVTTVGDGGCILGLLGASLVDFVLYYIYETKEIDENVDEDEREDRLDHVYRLTGFILGCTFSEMIMHKTAFSVFLCYEHFWIWSGNMICRIVIGAVVFSYIRMKTS